MAPDLCDQLRLDELASSLDLTIAPWLEPSPHYETGGPWRGIGCEFAAVSDDRRYETSGTDFDPSGDVLVRVFEETDDAVQHYQATSRSFERGYDNATRNTSGTLDGWWDQGTYLEPVWVFDGRGIDEVARSETDLSYVVQHRNLWLTATMAAAFPTDETEAALAEVHEILKAFIDEVVAHLTLSAE